jgi:hypothetical protein
MPLRKFLERLKGSSEDIFSIISDYTLLDKQRLGNLAALADYCNKAKIDGDFVECGTYKG